MIGWLLTQDTRLFMLLNGALTHPVLDRVMPALTDQENWYPFLIGLWLALLIWGGRKGRIAGAALVLAVALSDQVSAGIMKPLFRRLRPCNALPLDEIRLLVSRSKAFSFPSSHAANAFSMATVTSWRWPKLSALFFGIAFLVAYSRVYVGVHYPFDTVVGAAVGVLCGRGALWGVLTIARLWKARGDRRIQPA